MTIKKYAANREFSKVIKLFVEKKNKSIFTKSDLIAVAVAYANVGDFNTSVKMLGDLFVNHSWDKNIGELLAKIQIIGQDDIGALTTYTILEEKHAVTYLKCVVPLLIRLNLRDKLTQVIVSNFHLQPEFCTNIIYNNDLRQACPASLKCLRRTEVKGREILIAKILSTARRYVCAIKILDPLCEQNLLNEEFMSLYVKIHERTFNSLKLKLALSMKNAGITIEKFGPNTINDYAVAAARNNEPEYAMKLLELGGLKETAPVHLHLNLADMYMDFGRVSAAGKIFDRLNINTATDRRVIKKAGDYFSKQKMHISAKRFYEKLYDITKGEEGALGIAKTLQDLALQSSCDEFLGQQNNSDPEFDRFSLYNTHYLPDVSSDFLLKRYEIFGQRIAEKFQPARLANLLSVNAKSSKIAIGILSSDFCDHPTLKFLGGFLDLGNYNDIDLFLISNTPKRDKHTQKLKETYDKNWIDICNVSVDAASKKISRLNLDFLIDLNGHTGNNRFDLLAKRTARKQISTMGLMCTTGLSFFDYLLLPTDGYIDRDEYKISEKLITTKNVIPYVSDLAMPSVASNFGKSSRTMVSCSRLIRHSVRLWSVWAKIQEVTDAKLIINCIDMRSEEVRLEVLPRLVAAGLKKELIELKFTTPIVQAYDEADITLDTFPSNSGTTLYESVLCGKPFVTLNEVLFLGSIGSSILQQIEHSQWVSSTEAEYVEKAVCLLNDAKYREVFFENRFKFREDLSKVREFSTELHEHLSHIKESSI